MSRLVWSNERDRLFETGLDRGVLYPKTGEAVPWNGLTSVDQDGGDSGTEYYIDGRPYLFLPKPKEFTASLKAYTYPDEFSYAMGVEEATDGMFLDSQMGDSFNLSYRTLIGNPQEGTEYGYKIHLIYNATVAPSSVTYASLTDSISPSEFSWPIQAVPIPIEGYRPTAHIIIDSTHQDAAVMAELENLLYGTEDTLASMPDPQTIYDILWFGDSIAITDHGDGTWSAVGSYHNVYMLNDTTFQIDNVIATDNGDGTYDITSTP